MAKRKGKTRRAGKPLAEIPAPQPLTFHVRDLVFPILIVVAGIAAYGNSLHGEFVLDDRRNIQDSLEIRTLMPSRTSLLGPPWTSFTGRPVAMFTLALNYKFSGMRVEGYHLFNVIVHVLAALTLWGFLRRTFRLPKLQPLFRGSEDVLAAIIAMLWVAHPLTTSSVSYISQRVESLMGLCYLLTLYCFIRGVSGRNGWYVAAIILCLVGLGVKEPIAFAPLFILLYDRTLISGSFAGALRQRRWVYAGLAATWIPFIALQSLHPHGPDVGFSFDDLSSIDYLKTQSRVIVHYLRLCFWPSPLILFYGWANIDVPILRTFPQYAPWGAAIVLLLGLSFWAIQKGSAAGLLGAWFFMILAPSSSIAAIPTEVIAEYRMYLPLIAVIIGVVTGTHLLLLRIGERFGSFQRRARTVAGAALASMILLALVMTTRDRNEDFRTAYALWLDAAQKLPHNPSVVGNLGILEYEAGRFDDAERHLRQALEANPKSGPARAALGRLLEKTRRLPEAIEQYKLACEYAPRQSDNFILLASALAGQGKTDQAIKTLRDAITQVPWEQKLHVCLGVMLTASGNSAEGNAYLDQAIHMDPDAARAHTQIGSMLGQTGAIVPAIEHLQKAVALSSTDPSTYSELANLLNLEGHAAEAIEQYRTALSLVPNDTAILNNLAWVEATSPDPSARNAQDALRHAEQAARQTNNQNPLILDTLAAAYAEAGQFDVAVRTLENALKLTGTASDSPDVQEMRHRLALFQQKQPFRDKPTPTSRP